MQAILEALKIVLWVVDGLFALVALRLFLRLILRYRVTLRDDRAALLLAAFGAALVLFDVLSPLEYPHPLAIPILYLSMWDFVPLALGLEVLYFNHMYRNRRTR